MARTTLAIAKKGTKLNPIHANIGIEVEYRRRIQALVEAMQKSILHWVGAKYRAEEDDIVMDASPSAVLQQVMKRLSAYWRKRFAEAAPELAQYFAQSASQRTTKSLQSILKKGGFAIEFKTTAEMNTVLQAIIHENVSLIKSIQSQHFTQIEGMVMRSVQKGGDYGGLSKQLQHQFGVSKRRAALISRDQNSKATAVIHKTRQKELNIKKAVWRHSHGAKTPRPEHLHKFDGEEYDVEKGMWSDVDQEWVWPGTPINCSCVSISIIPGL